MTRTSILIAHYINHGIGSGTTARGQLAAAQLAMAYWPQPTGRRCHIYDSIINDSERIILRSLGKRMGIAQDPT